MLFPAGHKIILQQVSILTKWKKIGDSIRFRLTKVVETMNKRGLGLHILENILKFGFQAQNTLVACRACFMAISRQIDS